DFVGDSLELSKKAQSISCKIIVFCGVTFMAETAKILSPEKKVLIPRKDARCPMADMIDAATLKEIRKKYPEAKVLSYVNTTAQVKAESDVCCTSANAVEVAKNMEADEIIFVPDRNLANYVASQLDKNKKIIPYEGWCYVHERIRKEDILKAKKVHPDAKIIVHPECRQEVIEEADMVASTGGMVKLAKNLPVKKIVIGTEEGLIHRLKKENPDKEFFTTGAALICKSMKLTRLEDVYISLKEEKYEVAVEKDVLKRAKDALERMFEYTG
ncbi:quinolinate synthase NadA, partial [Candidatus Aerophobetes bacterium]|nr:quinolinate synthase NadA [Candidatus Aerophobetes bacterium]